MKESNLLADLPLGYPGLQTFYGGNLDKKQDNETTKGKMEIRKKKIEKNLEKD